MAEKQQACIQFYHFVYSLCLWVSLSLSVIGPRKLAVSTITSIKVINIKHWGRQVSYNWHLIIGNYYY